MDADGRSYRNISAARLLEVLEKEKPDKVAHPGSWESPQMVYTPLSVLHVRALDVRQNGGLCEKDL